MTLDLLITSPLSFNPNLSLPSVTWLKTTQIREKSMKMATYGIIYLVPWWSPSRASGQMCIHSDPGHYWRTQTSCHKTLRKGVGVGGHSMLTYVLGKFRRLSTAKWGWKPGLKSLVARNSWKKNHQLSNNLKIHWERQEEGRLGPGEEKRKLKQVSDLQAHWTCMSSVKTWGLALSQNQSLAWKQTDRAWSLFRKAPTAMRQAFPVFSLPPE